MRIGSIIIFHVSKFEIAHSWKCKVKVGNRVDRSISQLYISLWTKRDWDRYIKPDWQVAGSPPQFIFNKLGKSSTGSFVGISIRILKLKSQMCIAAYGAKNDWLKGEAVW